MLFTCFQGEKRLVGRWDRIYDVSSSIIDRISAYLVAAIHHQSDHIRPSMMSCGRGQRHARADGTDKRGGLIFYGCD
jgi:hypothetical protein